jgi:hypothetical protein
MPPVQQRSVFGEATKGNADVSAAAMQCIFAMAVLMQQLRSADGVSIYNALQEDALSEDDEDGALGASAKLGQHLCRLHAMTVEGIPTAGDLPQAGDPLYELAGSIMPTILDAAGHAQA